MIRRILPKGKTFDNLTQEDVNKIMSHINSYKRKKLNNCSTLQLFNLLYGHDISQKFGIVEIKQNEINLSSNLIKKDQKSTFPISLLLSFWKRKKACLTKATK